MLRVVDLSTAPPRDADVPPGVTVAYGSPLNEYWLNTATFTLTEEPSNDRRVVTVDSVPDTLTVTASTADGSVMGLRHTSLAVEGVQFHPESILTPCGPKLLANFLAQGEIGRLQHPASAAQRHRHFHRVFQLPDVSRPGECTQPPDGLP